MELTTFLETSSATPEFKAAVDAYRARGAADRIRATRPAPPVKVMRVLTQLLHAEPDLPIEQVTVDAYSGCSDFRGVLEVTTSTGVRRFAFSWCCKWRAQQEGWVDYFGFPDQMQAARMYGWDCFEKWQELPSAARREQTESVAV